MTSDNGRQSCPIGLVAVGINGRAGHLVNSVGLICGAPRITKSVKPVARVKVEQSPTVGGRADERTRTGGAASQQGRASNREIRCRGYSRPGGLEYVFFEIGSRPGSAGETIVTYEIAFSPSPMPAGVNAEALKPGNCSWLDRTIGDSGPFRIRFETVANAQLKQRLQGVGIDNSPTAAESYPDVRSIPRYLKVDNHFWSFGDVTDSGRGYFEAGINGHWKQPGVRPVPRVTLPGTESRTNDSICDSARAARERNSPAARGLEEQCRAHSVSMQGLEERGFAIAQQDPLAIQLRDQQPDDDARRGFDIGMAAAEGQTAPGPGKDRMRDGLASPERVGFIAAVAFSLERNKYAARAAKGAEIAEGDPSVAEARNAEEDVFFRLGFDIATAIFGNPKLGAQGNTALGPGSQGIRNSLSRAGQRGFDAAVQLHFGRNY